MNPCDLTSFIAAECGWVAAILDLVAARDAITDPDTRLDTSAVIAAWLEHRMNLLRN
jgi:hypothetical protein